MCADRRSDSQSFHSSFTFCVRKDTIPPRLPPDRRASESRAVHSSFPVYQTNRLRRGSHLFVERSPPSAGRIAGEYTLLEGAGFFRTTKSTTAPPTINVGTRKSVGDGWGGGGINNGANISANISPAIAAIYLSSKTRSNAPPPSNSIVFIPLSVGGGGGGGGACPPPSAPPSPPSAPPTIPMGI